jgi:hypothetical protein
MYKVSFQFFNKVLPYTDQKSGQPMFRARTATFPPLGAHTGSAPPLRPVNTLVDTAAPL